MRILLQKYNNKPTFKWGLSRGYLMNQHTQLKDWLFGVVDNTGSLATWKSQMEVIQSFDLGWKTKKCTKDLLN